MNTTATIPSAAVNAGIPLTAWLGYSIEFSSFVDFAGNDSAPNTFSDNLLNNIGNLTGTKPYIRVGGNTQDFALFNETLEVAQVGIVDPDYSNDYPRFLTIGPSFYQSFNPWPGAKYIYGFNLAENGTTGQQNLISTAQYACQALSDGNLAYLELGNEPDLYKRTSATGARRPPTWNETDYVAQWQSGITIILDTIAQYCPSLSNTTFYAPSFAGTNNDLSPLKTWQSGLANSTDIAAIVSHNYISGATVPGVTLQGTLMNHTRTSLSVAAQVAEANSIRPLRPDLPFILGETNSLYNQGKPGLSDSFGAALWALDFAMYCVANNISRVQFHQGTGYRYASWQPVEGVNATKGTKAPYYGNVAAAAFVGDTSRVVKPQVVELPLGEEMAAAYVVYEEGTVVRALVVNLQEYNATEGNVYLDEYTRPVFKYGLQLPMEYAGAEVGLRRLIANGSDAITGVTWDGYSYNFELDNGMPVLLGNITRSETALADATGLVKVEVSASSAVVLDIPACAEAAVRGSGKSWKA